MEFAGFELEPLRSNEKARVYNQANILIHIISRFSNKLFYVPLVTPCFHYFFSTTTWLAFEFCQLKPSMRSNLT